MPWEPLLPYPSPCPAEGPDIESREEALVLRKEQRYDIFWDWKNNDSQIHFWLLEMCADNGIVYRKLRENRLDSFMFLDDELGKNFNSLE